MLNEFLEFKAYVMNPESATPRVQPYLLTQHFHDDNYLIGIEEIMTVIARAFIYSEGQKIYGKSGEVNEKLIHDTIELLHRWTGFSDTEERKRTKNTRLDEWMKEHSVEDGWLKRYWLFQFDAKGGKKAERWDELQKKWNKSLNSPMDYSSSKITYKNVIANALEKGPLRNRYLVVKKSEEQVGKKIKAKDNKRFKYLTDESHRQETSDMKIMKVIAAYLIHQEYHPEGQKEVWIKNSELSRWYALDDGKNGKEAWYPTDAFWNGKPIYTHHNLKGSYTKVVVDQDYLLKYDFHIIDIEDADQYKDTHWILEDLGHGLKNCWGIK